MHIHDFFGSFLSVELPCAVGIFCSNLGRDSSCISTVRLFLSSSETVQYCRNNYWSLGGAGVIGVFVANEAIFTVNVDKVCTAHVQCNTQCSHLDPRSLVSLLGVALILLPIRSEFIE